MKFKVLKDVVIDGSAYSAGSEVDISHDKTARLEMLGFIEMKSTTANRAVKSTRTRKPKADSDAEE